MGDPTAEPGDGSSAPEEVRIARASGYLTAITDVRVLGVRMMMEAVGYLLHPHSNRRVKVPYRNHYCPKTKAASYVWGHWRDLVWQKCSELRRTSPRKTSRTRSLPQGLSFCEYGSDRSMQRERRPVNDVPEVNEAHSYQAEPAHGNPCGAASRRAGLETVGGQGQRHLRLL